MAAAATAASAADPTSFVIGEGKFVKDEFAVYSNGVARHGRQKVFAVDPADLQRGAMIGRGVSSVVQLALHKPTQTVLALKIMNVFDKSKRHQLIRELTALYDADCHALVQFFGAFYNEGEITLCLEYMDGGSLSHVLTQVGPMPEDAIAAIGYQVLWGLAYMKHEKRLHRDLKPSNLLLASDGRVKLSDFGVSADLRSSIGVATSVTGTFAYLSPERIKHEAYSFPADIWAFGLCLLEAAHGAYPYPLASSKSYIELADAIVNGDVPAAPPHASPELVQLLDLCLHKEPEQRMPPDVLLGSPFFTSHGIKDLATATATLRAWVARVRSGGGVATDLSPAPEGAVASLAAATSPPQGASTEVVGGVPASAPGGDGEEDDVTLAG